MLILPYFHASEALFHWYCDCNQGTGGVKNKFKIKGLHGLGGQIFNPS